MPSTRNTQISTVAAAVAIAVSSLGLPVAAASAAPAPTYARAAMKLAEQPLATDQTLVHRRVKATTSYLIRSGDTLGAIARRHGTTVETLRAANHISGNRIYKGERLTIPANSAGKKSTTKKSAPSRRASATGAYTVKSGDTLGGIARARRVTVAAIRNVNSRLANSNHIYVGETIQLPSARAPHKGAEAQERRKGSASKVGKTFAGRTYKDEVTNAAQANKDALHRRQVPSRQRMRAMVAATATSNGVDPKLAQAISYQESGFNMRAVSPANAVGVMQVIPSSVRWAGQLTGRDLNALNPRHNVLAGVIVLKANLRASGGDPDKAIAGYYQGLRSVNSNGMYADTKAYVASVKSLTGHM